MYINSVQWRDMYLMAIMSSRNNESIDLNWTRVGLIDPFFSEIIPREAAESQLVTKLWWGPTLGTEAQLRKTRRRIFVRNPDCVLG